MSDPQQGPPQGWAANLIHAAKSLSLAKRGDHRPAGGHSCACVHHLSALNGERIMDRLMSTYEEIAQPSGCTLQACPGEGRPGPVECVIWLRFSWLTNRWFISVVLYREPTEAGPSAIVRRST